MSTLYPNLAPHLSIKLHAALSFAYNDIILARALSTLTRCIICIHEDPHLAVVRPVGMWSESYAQCSAREARSGSLFALHEVSKLLALNMPCLVLSSLQLSGFVSYGLRV